MTCPICNAVLDSPAMVFLHEKNPHFLRFMYPPDVAALLAAYAAEREREHDAIAAKFCRQVAALERQLTESHKREQKLVQALVMISRGDYDNAHDCKAAAWVARAVLANREGNNG